MRARQAAILITLSLAVTAGCDRRAAEYELRGETMGTTFSVKMVSPPPSLSRAALQSEIDATLDAIVMLTSTYEDSSELSRFNADESTDWIAVSSTFCELVDAALGVSRATRGAFDITVGPIVNLWGFGPSPARAAPPSASEIEAALARVGYQRVETRCDQPAIRKAPGDVYLDLSGWAKGYAVDRVTALLDERGIANYLVEIGGELRVRGRNARGQRWGIAIEKPLPLSREPERILRLSDVAVATSGDYRNYFEVDGRRFSHIVDARTGRPVQHELAAVTVIAASTAEADAMATALLVLGPEDGPRLAEQLELAGFFLVRKNAGLEVKATTRFDQMVKL